jgi:hypothetical protein
MMRPDKQAVRFLFLICLVLSAAKCHRAQPLPEPAFTLKAVSPNVWAAIDRHEAQAANGANAGFVIGEDSVAVIDTFASREAAKQLLTEVHKLTKLPVRDSQNDDDRRSGRQRHQPGGKSPRSGLCATDARV